MLVAMFSCIAQCLHPTLGIAGMVSGHLQHMRGGFACICGILGAALARTSIHRSDRRHSADDGVAGVFHPQYRYRGGNHRQRRAKKLAAHLGQFISVDRPPQYLVGSAMRPTASITLESCGDGLLLRWRFRL